jgi:excisionase family DNA binding protein
MKKQTAGWTGLEPLMTVAELAEYLGVPVTTIYDWRVDSKGPPALRFGRQLKFAVGDVQTWLDSQRETPGAPEPGAR